MLKLGVKNETMMSKFCSDMRCAIVIYLCIILSTLVSAWLHD